MHISFQSITQRNSIAFTKHVFNTKLVEQELLTFSELTPGV